MNDADTNEPPPVPGALYVGATNILVPDASADLPLLVSTTQDQPLCKPKQLIQSAHTLQVLKGYDFIILTNQINSPRKLLIDYTNHLLVSSPTGIHSVRMDKCGNSDIQLIYEGQVQSMALFRNRLYVVGQESVMAFTYSDGQHSPLSEGVEVIHNTGTEAIDLTIDLLGHAYVARGDVIKRFNVRFLPVEGFDFERDGEIYAYGTNTQGLLGLDAQSRLWGINGVSLVNGEIKRADISASENLASGIAEELNVYETPNTNYGFPYCMTEYKFTSSDNRGRQWAHPDFMSDSINDDYCQQHANNLPPAVPLPPNSIASSVHFFMGQFCSVGDLKTGATSVGLPCNWTDTPILANHGSGNVVHLPFDDVGHNPRWDKHTPEVILSSSQCTHGACFTPFGLAVDHFGRLLVSSDESNEIVMISRIYNEKALKVLTDKAALNS
ncbi:uncharacterized protein BX663DRAFT_489681 [Cokeromyces recurvatus]|uniref:uncharacterized protein n=1 Tax=Cokeromyces recurvatus TaxID=90255 RepID=UPI0022208BFE|nr:uncharacterized protein BX663DRAFT_489681 [Cokeromyces recurvatus]KAI7898912.1 hypothetical protein BX663DRAFT_489681 [Cokeromyces recurvatus]